jgi:hypothetical protein
MSARLGLRAVATVAAVAGAAVFYAAPRAMASDSEQVTATRPAGEVLLGDVSIDSAGHLDVTLVDSRPDDPGWAATVTLAGNDDRRLAWASSVVTATPSFVDAAGGGYVPQASVGTDGSTLAWAPAGHGLGVTHVVATLSTASRATGWQGSPTVTITVI